MIPIAYGGSTKEGEVSFSAGIDEGFRRDVAIALVIVERDARAVISVTCGGKKHGVQTKPARPRAYTTGLRHISRTRVR
jgi:hypothetical protein